jgi:hypothetical protein
MAVDGVIKIYFYGTNDIYTINKAELTRYKIDNCNHEK